MKTSHRHRAYWAFLGHRLSGLALALFLPFHFHVLAMALDSARLDAFLTLAELPAFKFGEWALVILLGLHMAFGIRLLVLELLPWRRVHDARIGWIGWGCAASLALGAVFLASVL